MDEIDDKLAYFICLQWFLHVFINVIVGLNKSKLLIVELQFQFIELGEEFGSIDQFLQTLNLQKALVAINTICGYAKDPSFDLFNILKDHIIEDLVFKSAPMAHKNMRKGLSKEAGIDLIFLIQFPTGIGLVLHELFLTEI
jgi:hypothetical protein